MDGEVALAGRVAGWQYPDDRVAVTGWTDGWRWLGGWPDGCIRVFGGSVRVFGWQYPGDRVAVSGCSGGSVRVTVWPGVGGGSLPRRRRVRRSHRLSRY